MEARRRLVAGAAALYVVTEVAGCPSRALRDPAALRAVLEPTLEENP